MSIDSYFRHIAELIAGSLIVQSSTVTYDKRTQHVGYIRGEVHFVDGSVLHLREFVDVQDGIDRLTYAYQYLSTNQALIFRYDNTGHHKRLNLPTYPHHKHVGSEQVVVSSSAPGLAEVLDEIITLVSLP